MSDFERELRKALHRQMPPEGFTERLLVRVAEQPARRSWAARLAGVVGGRRMRWAATAAVVLVLMFGGLRYERQRRIQREGEQAKRQVLLALKMTARQLRSVEKSLQQWNVSR